MPFQLTHLAPSSSGCGDHVNSRRSNISIPGTGHIYQIRSRFQRHVYVTSQVTWKSSSSSLATISTAGLATGVSVGTVSITANIENQFGPVAGTSDMAVAAPPPTVARVGITMTFGDDTLNACPGEQPPLPYRDVTPATAPSATRRWILALSMRMLAACVIFLSVTAFAQTTDPSTFSDLSTEYDGGVANPTDGSTGNVLQQTLFAAYFWGVAHGGARATVVVSSEYPISGTRILVPGNVDLVCSSYSPHTYSGGCLMYQTDPGNNTPAGGSPLLVADYSIGVLADRKTWCSILDKPQQLGCTIINSAGASIRGFTLYGGGSAAGGADVGIRVAAGNIHVEDTAITGFFGGPGIQVAGGLNNSFDWNYGTNVDTWWCAHPSQLTHILGGMDLGGMVDGEASNNQYSTGCSFAKYFTVSLEYPYIAAMYVAGAGNLIQNNLLQVDGIGLITDGMEHRVVDNRVEYTGREAIRNVGHTMLFSGNRITSACLDPNLINLRPGSLDNGIPRHPSTPTFLHKGYIVMDPSGNVEQVISNSGTSAAVTPDWAVQPGGTTPDGEELTWENMGPWPTDSSPLSYWAQPSLVTGVCYAVNDYNLNGGNTWSANEVGQEVGVNGWSYLRGSYFISGGFSSITGNMCDGDLPDAYGNGQCWWGGDLFANGGPAYLAPNGERVTASGGGTAWVGDYSVLLLADNIPRHYDDFQGMSDGQLFSVTSTTVANVIDPWSLDTSGAAVYGHPSLKTCTGGPVIVAPGAYYEFYYDSKSKFGVTQVNCSSGSGAGASGGLASVVPGSLNFASQVDGTTSITQTVTVTNSSGSALNIVVAISDDFSQTSTCGETIGVGASCTIDVAFTPTIAGAHAGVLTITDNGSNSAQSVVLTGLGTEPSSGSATIALSSSATSLKVTAIGESTKAILAITPQNGFAGTVNLKCIITSDTKSGPIVSPTCSLSPAQVAISNNTADGSTLVISTQPSSVAATNPRVLHFRSISLAGLSLLGLLPFRRLRRKAYMLSLSVLLVTGMTGCGYTPALSNASGSYKVLITATSGTSGHISMSIPLEVQ
jgi:Bacterial Ig-like domain (group 2)